MAADMGLASPPPPPLTDAALEDDEDNDDGRSIDACASLCAPPPPAPRVLTPPPTPTTEPTNAVGSAGAASAAEVRSIDLGHEHHDMTSRACDVTWRVLSVTRERRPTSKVVSISFACEIDSQKAMNDIDKTSSM